MGKQYSEITPKLTEFIENQKLFFVGTATADGRVNISPKGLDSLRIIDKNRVIWLNVTGSGNETAAHIQENPRMTLLFSAFQGKPMTLRLYGKAGIVHHYDQQWNDLYRKFDPIPGARQIFDLDIDLVQTSCGMSIPYFEYLGSRDELNKWATKKGEQGIKEYWGEKNQLSIDGKPTYIINKKPLII